MGRKRIDASGEMKKFETAMPLAMWEQAKERAAAHGMQLVTWLRYLVSRELTRAPGGAGGEDQVLTARLSRKQRDAATELLRGAIAGGWTRTAKARENVENAIAALEDAAPAE